MIDQVQETKPRSTVRSSDYPPKTPKRSFADQVIPRWGKRAARQFLDYRDSTAWALGVFLGLVALAFGAGLVFGNGLLSIRGTWEVLGALGVPVSESPIPVLAWWAIPAVLILIQSIGRHIDGLRWLWWPSLVFDGVTTALWLALPLRAVLPLELVVAIAVGVGYGIAWGSDRALMGALGMLWELWKGR